MRLPGLRPELLKRGNIAIADDVLALVDRLNPTQAQQTPPLQQLSLSLSIYLYIYLYIYLSIYLSVYLSTYLSTYLPAHEHPAHKRTEH